jgi:RNA polymerase sigma-70 factor (ECF subfamily)
LADVASDWSIDHSGPPRTISARTPVDSTECEVSAELIPNIGALPHNPTEHLGLSDEAAMVSRLRAGDEATFVGLVERHGPSLRRLARLYATDAVAEEVVQETWLAVLNGIDRFEGRAALRTWIVRILINLARERSRHERRQVPFSALAEGSSGAHSSVDPDRFRPATDDWPGHWVSYPERWDEQPELRFLASEGVAVARAAIQALPAAQRDVVNLRDVEGWSAAEVAEALGITDGNQRVLLHRGRAKVRSALEAVMARTSNSEGSVR